MKPQENNISGSQAWGECPAGELQDLSRRLKTAERRRQQFAVGRTLAGTAAASAALVLSIGMLLGGDANPGMLIGGISCADCQATFADYHEHLVNDAVLAESTADQMAAHMTKCEACREMYDAKFPGDLEAAGVLTTASSLEVSSLTELGFAAAF